jgi:uncharacterized protein YciI
VKYLVLTIRKPEFNADFVPAHYAFLDGLREDGSLEQAGPFTDRSGGAYVVAAQNLDEARRIAERDPLHISNSSAVTVHEWDAR